MKTPKVCVAGFRPEASFAPGIRVVCIGERRSLVQAADWEIQRCLAEGIARKPSRLTIAEIRFLQKHYSIRESATDIQASFPLEAMVRQLILRKFGRTAFDPERLHDLSGAMKPDHEYLIDISCLGKPRLIGYYVSTFEIPS